MDLIVAGPGRAGGALCIAASRAGHRIVGILARGGGHGYGPSLDWAHPLPRADLLLVAVRDDAIDTVAERLAGLTGEVAAAAHLSGFAPVAALEPLRRAGTSVGGFHPLQTLPDPETGAAALPGAHVGIGGDRDAVVLLEALADSLGMKAFPLSDEARPRYHAAAAAASNFVVTALATAGELFDAAGIQPEVAHPLVQTTVGNAYAAGPDRALTGPIARGDAATVRGHLAAAGSVSESLGRRYRLLAEATAILAHREEDVESWK